MILERVMRRFGCKRILNNIKREISKLMGLGMMMQNMAMGEKKKFKCGRKIKV